MINKTYMYKGRRIDIIRRELNRCHGGVTKEIVWHAHVDGHQLPYWMGARKRAIRAAEQYIDRQ
jgi:hypothetical protein